VLLILESPSLMDYGGVLLSWTGFVSLAYDWLSRIPGIGNGVGLGLGDDRVDTYKLPALKG
jgi:hypothetical protein